MKSEKEIIQKKEREIIIHRIFFSIVLMVLIVGLVGEYLHFDGTDVAKSFQSLEAMIFGSIGVIFFPILFVILEKIKKDEILALKGISPKI